MLFSCSSFVYTSWSSKENGFIQGNLFTNIYIAINVYINDV